MSATKIEWTRGDDGSAGETWNPTTGCDRVSPGCDNCYALTLAKRLKGMGSAKYQRDGDPRTSGPGFGLTTHQDALNLPLSWRKPRRVFVNSMSDLFHNDVPDEFIAQVWTVMAATPQHTYQILTKRHARMRAIVRRIAWRTPTTKERQRGVHGSQAYVQPNEDLNFHLGPPRVLPNVWLGVSAEDQKRADLRVPALLDTPAAVRFVSAEPLLGPLDLTRYVCAHHSLDRRTDDASRWVCRCGLDTGMDGVRPIRPPRLDWVIAGGESGPAARPMHPDWARALRDQCTAAGTSFFFKQWGDWIPEALGAHVITERTAKTARYADFDGGHRPANVGTRGDAATCHRVGKKAAGRQLDGRTWDQYPTTTTVGGTR